MILTRSDLNATIGQGQTVREAAKVLRCATKTIIRSARVFGIELPERPRRVPKQDRQHGGNWGARVDGEAAWREAFEKHGPAVFAVAKALEMDRSYVRRQLLRYNIIGDHDAWLEAQDDAA